MDFSIYDAIQAGFDKVVFVIRKDLEEDFRRIIGDRIEKKIKVEYAFQEVDDIPAEYKEKFAGRTKPWVLTFPINTITALLGIPIVIWVVIRNKSIV